MKYRVKKHAEPVWWTAHGHTTDRNEAPEFEAGYLPAIPDLLFRETDEEPGRWFAIGDPDPVWVAEPVSEREVAAEAAANNLALCVSNLVQVDASARDASTVALQGAHESALRYVRCAQAALRYCAARLDQARVQLESLTTAREEK
jgi:hypothetical protein